MADQDKLDFTGERFTPECEREIWYEHYHRYAFAKRVVEGKKVLDIASGEGYGSYILSGFAKSVIGMDIDSASIKHAKNKYQNKNLKYIKASCLAIPLEDESVDVVVSFETLEHLAEQKEMLAEFNRVLKKNGLLIISTPDKKHYSDATGFSNEFHVKELYKDEFKFLLDEHWQHQSWYSQAMAFHSLMEKHKPQQHTFSSDILNDSVFLQDKKLIESMYYVVLASKQVLGIDLPDLHLFADQKQTIYGHYNAVIRAHISYENKYNQLKEKHDKLLKIPLLGRIVNYFIQE